ncbi:hypothetical protein [Halomarina pelagica]|uniref:hypothetical protein n=1 Tax=Halomarina pelagica TaxID=2961599 RepID=UPI0020C2E83A|nr:hypothetical protein [Halomarina sp. BND7]
MAVVGGATIVILIAVSAFVVWGLPPLMGGEGDATGTNGTNGTNASNGSTGVVGATPSNDTSGNATDAPSAPVNRSTPNETAGGNRTETPAETPTPSEPKDWHTLVVDGQSSSTAEYSVTVSGRLEPVRGGTGNDQLSADGRTLEGRVTDGYDSYRFTGDLKQLQVSGTALVKVDGRVVLSSGGATDQRPGDGSDADRGGAYAVRVKGGAQGTGPLVTVDGERHVVEPGETFRIPAGAERVEVVSMEYLSPKTVQFLENGNVVAEQRLDDTELQMVWTRGGGGDDARLPGPVEISATGPGTQSGDPVLHSTAYYGTSDGVLRVSTNSDDVYGRPQKVTAEVGYHAGPPDEEVTLTIRSGDMVERVTEVPADGTVEVTLSA